MTDDKIMELLAQARAETLPGLVQDYETVKYLPIFKEAELINFARLVQLETLKACEQDAATAGGIGAQEVQFRIGERLRRLFKEWPV